MVRAPARATWDEALEESQDYGVRLLGFLDDEPGRVQLKENYERYPLSHLAELLRRHVIDEIIFAVDSSKLSEMEDVFLRCDEEGVRTRVRGGFLSAREQPGVSGSAGNQASADVFRRASRRNPAAAEARYGSA